jgi:DNA-directed RNA polymerase subunit RPC12/RpoP
MTEKTPRPTTLEKKPAVPEKRGIECPACGCRHFHVLYTRRAVGKRILRRRECRNCGRRVTTYEGLPELNCPRRAPKTS